MNKEVDPIELHIMGFNSLYLGLNAEEITARLEKRRLRNANCGGEDAVAQSTQIPSFVLARTTQVARVEQTQVE